MKFFAWAEARKNLALSRSMHFSLALAFAPSSLERPLIKILRLLFAIIWHRISQKCMRWDRDVVTETCSHVLHKDVRLDYLEWLSGIFSGMNQHVATAKLLVSWMCSCFCLSVISTSAVTKCRWKYETSVHFACICGQISCKVIKVITIEMHI